VIAVYSSAIPVIVVAAGPAGATAARALAGGGIAVRLLDRSAFPRNKYSWHRHCRCRGGRVAHLAARCRRTCNDEIGAELRDSMRNEQPR
jgi:flavin-dependent dehydrogenase